MADMAERLAHAKRLHETGAPPYLGAPVDIDSQLRRMDKDYPAILAQYPKGHPAHEFIFGGLDIKRATHLQMREDALKRGISTASNSGIEVWSLLRSPAVAKRSRVTEGPRRRERRDGSRRNLNKGSPDDPDLPEPASRERYCHWVGCGDRFVPKRSDQQYCTPNCGLKAWRARQRPLSVSEPVPWLPAMPVPEVFHALKSKCECEPGHPAFVDPETGDCFWCGHPSDPKKWGHLANQELRLRLIDVGPRPLTILDGERRAMPRGQQGQQLEQVAA